MCTTPKDMCGETGGRVRHNVQFDCTTNDVLDTSEAEDLRETFKSGMSKMVFTGRIQHTELSHLGPGALRRVRNLVVGGAVFTTAATTCLTP